MERSKIDMHNNSVRPETRPGARVAKFNPEHHPKHPDQGLSSLPPPITAYLALTMLRAGPPRSYNNTCLILVILKL